MKITNKVRYILTTKFMLCMCNKENFQEYYLFFHLGLPSEEKLNDYYLIFCKYKNLISGQVSTK